MYLPAATVTVVLRTEVHALYDLYIHLIMMHITVVSRVSAHGRLNITRDFGPHGHLPGIKIPYVCIEAATVAP